MSSHKEIDASLIEAMLSLKTTDWLNDEYLKWFAWYTVSFQLVCDVTLHSNALKISLHYF
jgi:hypothetical protein